MGSGTSTPSDKHVLIIGAGYGGVQLATTLLKRRVNFTIVDTKDFFYHNVASVRSVVLPGFANKTVVPYEPAFGEHFKQGKVVKIDTQKKVVTLEGGTELTYDILVVAAGSFGPMKEVEGTRESVIEKYSKIAEEVKKSKKVLLIGGGPVGVEIAAEIGTIYGDEKIVTIINSTSQLISPDASAKYLERVNSILNEMHVTVDLDDKVINLDELPDGVHGSYHVKTEKGRTVEADIVLKCIGLKVNSSAYVNGLSEHMEETGALKVNEFFQVEGFEDVFAFGDCCSINAPRLAYVAKLQADVVAKNLVNLMGDRKLDAWNPGAIKFFMAVSMGSKRGVFATKAGYVLPEFLIVNFKSKDMMTAKTFKDMNQVVPP